MCLPHPPWLADPQDALHCLHVSRDEACLTVSFSRPLVVSTSAAPVGEFRGIMGLVLSGLTGVSLSQVGPGTDTLLLMADESPLMVEWRTPHGRSQPSHVWVSQRHGVLRKQG